MPKATDQPLVSFLIVAHEAGAYIRECLESVWAQTYPNIDVVLVDCASTDGGVAAMMREYGSSRAIQLVRSETNLGPAAGAMFGLPYCRGEYIARLDADDLALPERVERQVRYLQSHPEKDAVGGDVLRIDPKGGLIGSGLSLRGEFMRQHAAKWYIGCFHTTLLVRRLALLAEGYNPTLFCSEDHELIEWMASRNRLGLVPLVVGLYRQHPASISQRHDSLLQLAGNEHRRQLSKAVMQTGGREELRRRDFGYLTQDKRLCLARTELNLWFEEASLKDRDWLGAAYFASINGRRLYFAVWMLRAVGTGAPWREWLALLLCRTVWSVRLRLANTEMVSFRDFFENGQNKSPRNSVRLGQALNQLRIFSRIAAISAILMALAYLSMSQK